MRILFFPIFVIVFASCGTDDKPDKKEESYVKTDPVIRQRINSILDSLYNFKYDLVNDSLNYTKISDFLGKNKDQIKNSDLFNEIVIAYYFNFYKRDKLNNNPIGTDIKCGENDPLLYVEERYLSLSKVSPNIEFITTLTFEENHLNILKYVNSSHAAKITQLVSKSSSNEK
jgi:hypothetical protein